MYKINGIIRIIRISLVLLIMVILLLLLLFMLESVLLIRGVSHLASYSPSSRLIHKVIVINLVFLFETELGWVSNQRLGNRCPCLIRN